MRDEDGGDDHGAGGPIASSGHRSEKPQDWPSGSKIAWVIKCVDAGGDDRWYGWDDDHSTQPTWSWSPTTRVTLFESYAAAEMTRVALALSAHLRTWVECVELDVFVAAAKLVESRHE